MKESAVFATCRLLIWFDFSLVDVVCVSQENLERWFSTGTVQTNSKKKWPLFREKCAHPTNFTRDFLSFDTIHCE